MAEFVTSDLHYFHKNIIKYSNRPFESVDEMNEGMISQWNEKISDGDEVYILGDMFFCNQTKAIEILKQLNGNLHIFFGNHDNMLRTSKKQMPMGYRPLKKEFEPYFASHQDYNYVMFQGKMFVMSHYALTVWDQGHRGAINLYGHSHGSLPEDPNKLQMDVGVDNADFKIYTMEEVYEYMEKKELAIIANGGRVSIDHH
jgi:calcineurin-like phosphoesterase family protein